MKRLTLLIIACLVDTTYQKNDLPNSGTLSEKNLNEAPATSSNNLKDIGYTRKHNRRLSGFLTST